MVRPIRVPSVLPSRENSLGPRQDRRAPGSRQHQQGYVLPWPELQRNRRPLSPGPSGSRCSLPKNPVLSWFRTRQHSLRRELCAFFARGRQYPAAGRRSPTLLRPHPVHCLARRLSHFGGGPARHTPRTGKVVNTSMVFLEKTRRLWNGALFSDGISARSGSPWWSRPVRMVSMWIRGA